MVRVRARSGVALYRREKMSNTLQTGRRRCRHLQNRIERCSEMKKTVFFFLWHQLYCCCWKLLLLDTFLDRYQLKDKWCGQSFTLNERNEYRSYLR